MVITVLEAQVADEKSALLETTYRDAVQGLDPGIAQTYLLRNTKEPGSWQILTIWESQEALEQMRQSGKTPRGVLIFRSAGAEPKLSILGVTAQASR